MAGKAAASALTLGALSASAAGAILNSLIGIALGFHMRLDVTVAIFIITLLLSLLVASTVGLMWHRFALRTKATALWRYTTSGGVAGLVFTLCAIALLAGRAASYDNGDVQQIAYLAMYGAFVGALTGTVSWLIRRPDRDAAEQVK